MSRSWILCLALGLISLVASDTFAQADVADVSSERITLAEKQVYFLIDKGDAKHNAEPRPLLIVLPGGNGSEEFNPFVRRIWKNALPQEFIVAQLVAVPSDDKKPIVWPTTNSPSAKQGFTTESFITDVVADVGKRANLDSQRIFALGWSSSGPALYASSATVGSPIKGFFVAMSVFRPSDLPQPNEAKAKCFYLLHSPDDRVCPFRMAQQAQAKLSEIGATVTMAEYAGGHGWRGDVFGNIRAGIERLAK